MSKYFYFPQIHFFIRIGKGEKKKIKKFKSHENTEILIRARALGGGHTRGPQGQIPTPLGLCWARMFCKCPFAGCDGRVKLPESQGHDLLCYLPRISRIILASQGTGSEVEPGSARVPDNAVKPQKAGSGQGVKGICQSHPPAGKSRALAPRRDECP